jgi:hypothetical protein
LILGFGNTLLAVGITANYLLWHRMHVGAVWLRAIYFSPHILHPLVGNEAAERFPVSRKVWGLEDEFLLKEGLRE